MDTFFAPALETRAIVASIGRVIGGTETMSIFRWLLGSGEIQPKPRERAQPIKRPKPSVVFPEPRLVGPHTEDALTPFDDYDTGQTHIEWQTVLAPNEYLAYRRPEGSTLIPGAQMIEITATGKAAENFQDAAYYDLISDIEEFERNPGEGSGEPYFGQDFLLRRTSDRVSIQRRYGDEKPAIIGSLPDEILPLLETFGSKLDKISVEVVEARIADLQVGQSVRRLVRYSINLVDLRDAVEERGDDEVSPNIPPAEAGPSETGPMPRTRPAAETFWHDEAGRPDLTGYTFFFTGTLSSLTRTEAVEAVKSLGGAAKGTISAYGTPGKIYLVAGVDSGRKVQQAAKLGIPALTEEAFLRMIGTG